MSPHAPPNLFRHFAVRTSSWVGSAGAFITAIAVIVAWAASGPLFHYSDTWQLWINTGTTIVTFLMVFVIQYTQNREARATQLKLDELLRAIKGAHNEMMDLEHLSDDELQQFEDTFSRLARAAKHTRQSMNDTDEDEDADGDDEPVQPAGKDRKKVTRRR